MTPGGRTDATMRSGGCRLVADNLAEERQLVCGNAVVRLTFWGSAAGGNRHNAAGRKATRKGWRSAATHRKRFREARRFRPTASSKPLLGSTFASGCASLTRALRMGDCTKRPKACAAVACHAVISRSALRNNGTSSISLARRAATPPLSRSVLPQSERDSSP